MSESGACLNARALLKEIHPLKDAFDRAYDAATSGVPSDIAFAQEQKRILEEKLAMIQDLVWPAETERLLDLRKQYVLQVDILKRVMGLEVFEIERSDGSTEEALFMNGIDTQRHRLPSFQEILIQMTEKRGILSKKFEKGFTKLLLVPFGMSLDEMIRRLRVYLFVYKGGVLVSKIEGANPVLDQLVTNADELKKISYDPDKIEIEGNVSGGRVKSDILLEQNATKNWHDGWRIIFIKPPDTQNDLEMMDRSGQERMSANDRIAQIINQVNDHKSDSFGEWGMTIEEWIVAFITQLEQTGTLLNQVGTVGGEACLTGATVTEGKDVVVACWTQDMSAIHLMEYDIDEQYNIGGMHATVRV